MAYRILIWLSTLLLLLSSVGSVRAQDTGNRPSQPKGQIGVHWQQVAGIEAQQPVLAGDVVLHRDLNALWAFDLISGNPLWSFEDETGVSDPVVHGETIFVTTGRQLVALDASDGSMRWKLNLAFVGELPLTERTTRQFTPVQPTIAGEVIYAALGPWAYAIDLETRAYRWRHETDGYVAYRAPVVAESSVLIALVDDNEQAVTRALDRNDGRRLWPMDNGLSGPLQDIVALDDSFIVRSATGHLVRLDAADGFIRWEVSCAVSTRDAMLVVDGQVIATCSDEMVSIDPGTGESHWLSWGVQVTPIGVMERAIIVTEPFDDGHMVSAIDLGTGERLWHYAFPSPTGERTRISTGITVDGRVIAVTRTGNESLLHLTAIGGTEGTFGHALPFELNPPAAGDFVTIAQATSFRAAPSIEGVVWADLEPGAQVLITGTSEEVNGTSWWKVINPASGDAGWIDPAAFQADADD